LSSPHRLFSTAFAGGGQGDADKSFPGRLDRLVVAWRLEQGSWNRFNSDVALLDLNDTAWRPNPSLKPNAIGDAAVGLDQPLFALRRFQSNGNLSNSVLLSLSFDKLLHAGLPRRKRWLC